MGRQRGADYSGEGGKCKTAMNKRPGWRAAQKTQALGRLAAEKGLERRASG